MIRFRYEPKFEEWRFLNRHLIWPRVRTPGIIGGLFLLLFATRPFLFKVVWPRQSVQYTDAGIIPVIILVIAAIFFVLAIERQIRKRWETAEELRVVHDYEITDQGVRTVASSLEGFMEWRYFVSADFAKGFIMLKTAQNQFYYFPLSIVPDGAKLLELIEQKTKVTDNWKKAMARRKKA
jgi:hypothetical protein